MLSYAEMVALTLMRQQQIAALRGPNLDGQAIASQFLALEARERLKSEAIAAAGGIPAAVACLSSSNRDAQCNAVVLLQCLAEDNAERCAAIVDAGAAPALVRLLHSSDESVVSAAARALSDTAEYGGAHVCAALRSAGAMQPLAQLLQHSDSDDVLFHCSLAFDNLVCDAVEPPLAAAASQAIPGLLRCLDAGRSADTRDAAASACCNLLNDRPECCEQFMAAGGLAAVICALSQPANIDSCETYLPSSCAIVLLNLAEHSPECCRAITAAGAVALLARWLRSRRWTTVEAAAAALDVLENSGDYSSDSIEPAVNTSEAAAGIDPLVWLTLLQRLAHSPLGPEVQAAAAAALSALRAGSFRGQGEPLADAAADALQPPADQPAPAPRVCTNPGCGATRGLRRCAGCGVMRYCSEACIRAHWRQHKPECRRLQAEAAAAGEAEAAAGGSPESSSAAAGDAR